MTRELLPARRPSQSFDLNHGGLHFAVQAGFYDEAMTRLGEIFISSPKTGSMAEVNARDAAVLLSICLQRGADPAKTLRALTHDTDGRPEGVVGRVLESLLPEEKAEPSGAAEALEPKLSPERARSMGYTGDQCSNCNSMRMKIAGHCMVCEDCGTTTGCS